MANHKKKKRKNARSGCLLCKPWKANGFGKRKRAEGEKFSDSRRRYYALVESKDRDDE